MRTALRLLAGALLALYPFWVWHTLPRWGLLPAAALLAAASFVRALARRSREDFGLFAIALALSGLSLFLDAEEPVRFYPAAVNAFLLWIFASSLAKGRMPMIERFARLADPALPEAGVRWCRRVTAVWCGFFVVNGSIALATVFLSRDLWLLWNGCLSYAAIGTLLLGEWLLRRIVQKRQR